MHRACVGIETRASRRIGETYSLSETDSGRGLALSQRGRGDTGDDNVLSVLSVLQPVQNRELDLGLVLAVRLDLIRLQADLRRDVSDQLGGLRGRNDDVARDLLEDVERVDRDLARARGVKVSLGRLESVLHELGNGHGSDTSRDGGDVGSDLGSSGKVDVSDETLTRLLGGV